MSTAIKTTKSAPTAKPGYKHTKLGWIPQEWEVKRLRALFELRGRVGWKGYTQADLRDSGPLTIGGKHINEGHQLNLSDPTYLSEEKYLESPEIMVRKGDLLFTQRGTLGRVAHVKEDIGQATINPSIVILRPKEAHCTEFVHAFLTSALQRKQMLIETASTGVPMLSQHQIGDFGVPLPPLPEQRRIAQVLGAWDRAIATVQLLLAAQQERKRGLMQELLTGRKRFKGFEPAGGTRFVQSRIGVVPSDWRELPMRKLFTERDECGFLELPLLSVTSTGVIPQSETERKDNSKEDKSAYKRICPGDIGYNTMRMWQGRSAVSRIEGIVSPAYTIITPTKLMDVEYARHLFQYQPMIHVFYRYSQGMASDTWNLKFKHFSPIVIPVPSIEEQRVIAALLTSIDKYSEELNKQLDHLTTQKRGLMQQLLTGAVRVKY